MENVDGMEAEAGIGRQCIGEEAGVAKCTMEKVLLRSVRGIAAHIRAGQLR